MSRPKLTISCPIDTYSGYGARARDFVKQLLKIDKYQISVLAQKWGDTRWGYLEDHKEDQLKSLIIDKVTEQPDIWIQHTVPNEFQKVGIYNIGLTAGIETTLCDPSWVEGVNRMDLLIVSSEHAKQSFGRSKYDLKNNNTGQIQKRYQVEVPIQVLFEGIETNKFNSTSSKHLPKTEVVQSLNTIPESFCFLTVGHWMQGRVGEDRKNIGLTVKNFLETFRNKTNKPALVLKSQITGTSILDRDAVLARIENIRKTIPGNLPNIYLLHGDIDQDDMNNLYNHPKIKALVSLTKGEGFGRPLLEFSFVNKPIITTLWSGHLDFLDKQFTKFIGGELKQVDQSAVVKKMILKESQWFAPNPVEVRKALKQVYNKYKDWTVKGKKQGFQNKQTFNIDKMGQQLEEILDQNLPDFPEQKELQLPELKLPKLEKIQ